MHWAEGCINGTDFQNFIKYYLFGEDFSDRMTNVQLGKSSELTKIFETLKELQVGKIEFRGNSLFAEQ